MKNSHAQGHNDAVLEALFIVSYACAIVIVFVIEEQGIWAASLPPTWQRGCHYHQRSWNHTRNTCPPRWSFRIPAENSRSRPPSLWVWRCGLGPVRSSLEENEEDLHGASANHKEARVFCKSPCQWIPTSGHGCLVPDLNMKAFELEGSGWVVEEAEDDWLEILIKRLKAKQAKDGKYKADNFDAFAQPGAGQLEHEGGGILLQCMHFVKMVKSVLKSRFFTISPDFNDFTQFQPDFTHFRFFQTI